MAADPVVLRAFAMSMLGEAILAEIAGDGRILSLAATVVEPDRTVMQYMSSITRPGVTRLIVPPERFADMNALRHQMIDVTPPEHPEDTDA